MPEKYSECVANHMDEFFHPLIPKSASNAQFREMYQKLLELSPKCLALKSMMQRSKEEYVIEKLDTKRPYSSIEQSSAECCLSTHWGSVKTE
jgi:hypothetical protein